MDATLLATTQNGHLETTGAYLPALFVDAGQQASYRFVKFFTATIRNPNTRAAYFRAVQQFCVWRQRRGLALEHVNPVQQGYSHIPFQIEYRPDRHCLRDYRCFFRERA